MSTFGQLDTNNVYNSGGDNNHQMNGGGNSSGSSNSGLQSVYANGNASTQSSSGYNNENSSNLGTRETGIIEKLLVSVVGVVIKEITMNVKCIFFFYKPE